MRESFSQFTRRLRERIIGVQDGRIIQMVIELWMHHRVFDIGAERTGDPHLLMRRHADQVASSLGTCDSDHIHRPIPEGRRSRGCRRSANEPYRLRSGRLLQAIGVLFAETRRFSFAHSFAKTLVLERAITSEASRRKGYDLYSLYF
jgi:hypothetical protein